MAYHVEDVPEDYGPALDADVEDEPDLDVVLYADGSCEFQYRLWRRDYAD